MLKIFSISVLLICFLSSCEVDSPDIGEVSNFKLTKMEGKVIKASFDVGIDNQNFFGFKMKRANIDLSANGQKLGVVNLDHKIKIKRKSNKTYTIPIIINLEDGAMFRLMKLVGSKTVEINLDGTAKGSIFLISKTIDIHEKKSIDGSQLKLPEKS